MTTEPAAQHSGATATCIVVGQSQLWVANVGDSQAYIATLDPMTDAPGVTSLLIHWLTLLPVLL